MKFSCDKHLIQSAAATAARAASAKSPIPALEGLLIQAGAGVRLTGYDLKKGIYTTIEAEVERPGSAVLNARLFTEMLRRLPDGIVTVEVDGKNAVKVKCGRSAYDFIAIDAAEYPELPEMDEAEAVSLPQKTLKAMIDETIFAVSTNESRPIHTRSLFEVSEDQTLTVVSVDGYRLALRRETVEKITGKPNFSFVVPSAALSEVEKICGESEDTATIVVGSRHVMFKAGDTMLVARRLEGEFLAYRSAIPSEYKIIMVADKRQLLNTIDRVSLIITEKQKSPIRCLFESDNMKIRVNTALGDASDECPMAGDGQELEIGFNNKYMMDALKAAPADNINLCMNSAISPCIITPADGKDNFLYMVLPVRLRAGQ